MSDETRTPTPTATRGDGWETVGRLKAKLKTTQDDLKAAQAERDDALKAREKAEKTWSESALKAENDLLKQQIRADKHRAEFNRLAGERGAPAEALDSLWKLTGWEAKTDTPDLEAMGAMLDEAKGKDGVKLLFNGSATPTPTPPKPPVGNGQGNKGSAPSSYTLDAGDPRLDDAEYQYRNFDRIAAAASERIARGEI